MNRMSVEIFPGIEARNSVLQSICAWDTSRPDNDSNVSDIMALDLPVTEFARINIVIHSTMIEREIIASYRNHIMWGKDFSC